MREKQRVSQASVRYRQTSREPRDEPSHVASMARRRYNDAVLGGKQYLIIPNALPIASMRAWAARSEHVGESPLQGTFTASRGFSITFTRAGLGELQARFPELWPFFATSVVDEAWRPLFGALEHLKIRIASRATRVFYFNLLSVPAGVNVGRHIDATLSHLSGRDGVTPLVVSVLYLTAPTGGRLVLWRGAEQVVEINPEPGMLVCFRGSLGHEVLTVEGADPRVSLVCEQYDFSPATAAQVAPISVSSRGMFGRVLSRVAANGEDI